MAVSATPPISPDGRSWWDGKQWQPLYTPDGKFRWNGQQWIPVAELAAAPAAPIASASQPEPERPSWLAQGVAVPGTPGQAAPSQPNPPLAAPLQASPAAASAAPAWQQAQMRPSQLGFELPQPLMGVIAVAIIGILFVAVWGYNQAFVHHDPEDPILVANSVKLAYHAGDVERISAQQKQTGRTTLPNGQSVDDYSSVDAIEDWRVIQIAGDGTATVGVKFEQLTGQFNGQNVAFNVNAAKEMQMVVNPDGRVVGGGTNGTAGGNATNSVPGSDQFFSILPDSDVHVGDTWGKEWERANPLGPGKVHYSTSNKFVRYDYLSDGRAAVIDTVATLPIDEVLNVRALLQLLGTDDPSIPANLSVSYRGNANVHMISFLSLQNRRIEKSGVVANFDFDMTFQNLPNTPAYAPLKGTWHFGGHQDADLTLLLPSTQ